MKLNMKNGYGEIKWENGPKYAGNFSNDQLHGKGTYYWKDGRVY